MPDQILNNVVATRCAILFEIEGNLHQIHLTREQELQIMRFVSALVGDPVPCSQPIKSIYLDK